METEVDFRIVQFAPVQLDQVLALSEGSKQVNELLYGLGVTRFCVTAICDREDPFPQVLAHLRACPASFATPDVYGTFVQYLAGNWQWRGSLVSRMKDQLAGNLETAEQKMLVDSVFAVAILAEERKHRAPHRFLDISVDSAMPSPAEKR